MTQLSQLCRPNVARASDVKKAHWQLLSDAVPTRSVSLLDLLEIPNLLCSWRSQVQLLEIALAFEAAELELLVQAAFGVDGGCERQRLCTDRRTGCREREHTSFWRSTCAKLVLGNLSGSIVLGCG